jgi:hypothetical protein
VCHLRQFIESGFNVNNLFYKKFRAADTLARVHRRYTAHRFAPFNVHRKFPMAGLGKWMHGGKVVRLRKE